MTQPQPSAGHIEIGSRLILVTGAGSGFGSGCVRKLHARGERVIAACFDRAEVETLRAEGIEAIRLDVTDAAAVGRLADLEIDVLVNNAGRGQMGPLATVPMADVRAVFEVNVFGTLQVTQALLPGMQRRRRGRIVIVSSIAGKFAGVMSGPYAMTKHALEAMARSLALEQQAYGIEVCKLNPGPYDTGFNDRMLDQLAPQVLPGTPEAELAEATCLRFRGRQLDPAEVEDALVGLCTAASVPFETFMPEDVLERYGLVPTASPANRRPPCL